MIRVDKGTMPLNIFDKIAKFSIIGIAFFLPLSSGAVNTLIGIGIAAWIAGKIARKELFVKPTAANLPLIVFFVVCCISIFNSIEPKTSVQGLVKVLKYIGIYFLLMEGVADIKTLKRAMAALMLGAVIACLDGLIQYLSPAGKDILRSNPIIINVGLRRMTAAFRHCNDFGVYLVTAAGIMWPLALYGLKKKARWLAVFSSLLVTGCIVLTFSRGAALAFFGSMLVMGIIKKDKLVLVVLAAALVAAPFLVPSGAREWTKTTNSALESFCNLDRIAFYRSAIAMIKDHPVIGVGVNTFMKAYPKYKVHDVDIITADECYAHNNYLQMAGEIGLLGLGVFLWVLAALFWEIWALIREKKGERGGEKGIFLKAVALGAGCAIIAFMLNGLTESSFYFSKIVVVFWFAAGLAASLKFIKTDYTD